MTALASPPLAPPVPLERLEALCDPGSLRLIRTTARSPRLGEKARDGDGVLAGQGTIGGEPVLCYADDPAMLGGSLGAVHAGSILEVLRMADRSGVPVVGFVSSAGARLQDGLAALHGYGEIFAAMTRLSGRVPQISVVSGLSAGGGAYAPALGDIVVMTEEASMFLTGPGVVREVMGEDVDAEGLGGPRVQAANGVCHFLAPDPLGAAALVRDLLAHLPAREGTVPSRSPARPPLPGDPGAAVPDSPRRTYDIREVMRRLVDDGHLLEYGERWARNVCCAFARLDGRPVGIVANQPKHIGGVLDSSAASKAARFVRTCHLFGLPLVALVDTPGFLPGTRQEAEGVIRHGAKLVHAFAEASVPKVSVVLRKSFGGAHIAMNAKGLGADLVLAWPQATLGVMGAEQAVGIVRRREIAAADDPLETRRALGAAYAEEHLGAARAAAEGFVDEVVAPRETRDRLAAALHLLDQPRSEPPRAHNVPL